MLSLIHVALSVVCFFVGAIIFFRPKGSKWHRRAGKIYSISMIVLNVAALGRRLCFGGDCGIGCIGIMSICRGRTWRWSQRQSMKALCGCRRSKELCGGMAIG